MTGGTAEPAVVLLVTPEPHYGGAERSLLELASGLLQHRSFKPHVIVAEECEWKDVLETLGIDWSMCPFPRLERTRNVFRLCIQLIRLLRSGFRIRSVSIRRKAVLVHANGLKAFLPAVLGAKLSRRPCVWHVRDYPTDRWLCRLAARLSSKTICVSHFIEAALEACTGPAPQRVSVIYNAAEVRSLALASPEGKTPVTFTMIAQFAPWKRHELFLKAAYELRDEGRDWRYVVAGTSLSRNDLRHEAKVRTLSTLLGMDSVLTFHGEARDVGDVLSLADIVVLPSYREPFGRVIVEAWRYSKPVIVSDCGAGAELVEHGSNGLLFDSGSQGALTRCMRELGSDATLRDRMGRSGKERSSSFTTRLMVQKVVDVYGELL